MFFVFDIMAFECGAVTYLYYEVNSLDRQSKCYQTVPRSHILLEKICCNWIFFRINVKLG